MIDRESLSMLTPQLLGRRWVGYEGASSFSIFWRACRLSHLRRGNLKRFIHFSISNSDDVFSRVIRSATVHEGLLKAYPQLALIENGLWSIERWWPFGGAVPFASIPLSLRFCPMCARSCYHSLVFQMPGVSQCPWHGLRLTEACPKCGKRMLAGYRAGLPIGCCDCGFDLVDEAATAAGDARACEAKKTAINAYLLRASEMRQRTRLIAPEESDRRAWSALDHFGGASRLEPILVDRVVTLRCDTRVDEPLVYPTGLESFAPGIARLPVDWSDAFRRIAKALLVTGGYKNLAAMRDSAAEVRQEFMWLTAYVGGRHVYVDTAVLQRAVLRCASRLSCLLAPSTSQAAGVLDELECRVPVNNDQHRLVKRILQRVLLRGYSDGARLALRLRHPSTGEKTSGRADWRLPWILMSMPESTPPSAEIVWTPQG